MITSLIPVTLRPPGGAYRSPGIHASAIHRCMALETGILKPEFIEEFSLVEVGHDSWWEKLDEVAKTRVCMGLAWEQWYIPQLPDVVDHPGEMCVEGIYMTHDGESLDVILTERGPMHVMALHEVKLTYKSIKTVAPRQVTQNPDDLPDLEGEWLWMAQLKAYCKGLQTCLAYLHVLFVDSDYSWPMRPKPLCWRIEFTPEEIESHWDLMIDYVRDMQQRDQDAHR